MRILAISDVHGQLDVYRWMQKLARDYEDEWIRPIHGRRHVLATMTSLEG